MWWFSFKCLKWIDTVSLIAQCFYRSFAEYKRANKLPLLSGPLAWLILINVSMHIDAFKQTQPVSNVASSFFKTTKTNKIYQENNVSIIYANIRLIRKKFCFAKDSTSVVHHQNCFCSRWMLEPDRHTKYASIRLHLHRANKNNNTKRAIEIDVYTVRIKYTSSKLGNGTCIVFNSFIIYMKSYNA